MVKYLLMGRGDSGSPLSLSNRVGLQYGRYSECVLPNLIGYRPVLGGCDCPSRQRVACQKSIQITRIFGMASAATIRMMSQQVVNLKGIRYYKVVYCEI